MQNRHGSDHLANSWADVAGIFDSHLTPSNSSAELINVNIIPPPSSYLSTYDQNHRLIHPLGDNIAHGDPASVTEPAAFPTLPPISTSRGNANSAEICNSTYLNHNPSAVTLTPVFNSASIAKGHDLEDELAFARDCLLAFTATVGTNSMSRTGSYASVSDFGLGASKGVSFKKSGKQSGTHVVSESIRRKQLTRLFYTLRSLLPNIVPQHDRCSVIDKACEYIKSLERQLQVLKRKAQILASIAHESNGDPKPKAKELNGTIIKISRDVPASPPPAISSPSSMADNEKACKLEAPHVQVTLAGNTSININIGCYEKKKGLFPVLLNIMERRHLQVLSANRSQQGQIVLYAIHVEAQQSSFPSKLELQKLKAELSVQAAAMLL